MKFKIILFIILWLTIISPISLAENCGSITTVQIGTNGPGYQTVPTINDTQNEEESFPDFIVKKVVLTDSHGREKYTFFSDQVLHIQAYVKNIGKADWSGEANNISVRFYLSQGYKEDAHSQWKRIGIQEIQKDHLNQGASKKEEYQLHLDQLDLGIYNVVVCVDRDQDDHNGEGEVPEIYESNNCSTEAVFQILEDDAYFHSICGQAGYTKEECFSLLMTILNNK